MPLAFVSGLSLWRSWQSAKLRHQAELVCHSPMLDYLQILKAADIHDRDNHRFARRRQSYQWPLMRTASCDTRPGLVSAGNDLLDGQLEIWEGGTEPNDGVFDAFRCGRHDPGLVFHKAGRKDLVEHIHFALTVSFLNQPPKDLNVLFS
jgi:hypothetical protein